MLAKQLLAHINHLTLIGYENGHYQWQGTRWQWQQAYLAEQLADL